MTKTTEVSNLIANLEFNFSGFFSLQRCELKTETEISTWEQHPTHKEGTWFCWMQQFKEQKIKSSAGRNQPKLYNS